MGAKAGLGLKFLQWFIRGVQFGCAALILAVYSYFLATLSNHNLHITNSLRAVEGISGIAVIYTLASLLLLCCLAGRSFTSFVAIVLDVAFIACFIYVAVVNKDGAGSCTGYLDTPFGRGNSGETTNEGSGGFTNLPSFHTACRLQTACLAVAIIAVFFFIFSILVEVALARHHHKEKRFGPSPANNYTSGYGSGPAPEKTAPKPGFFSRFRRNKEAGAAGVNHNILPEHSTPADLEADRLHDTRQSYGTDNTAIGEQHPEHYKYENGYGHLQQDAGVAEMGGSEAPPRLYGGQYANRQANHGATQPPPPQNYRYDDGIY